MPFWSYCSGPDENVDIYNRSVVISEVHISRGFTVYKVKMMKGFDISIPETLTPPSLLEDWMTKDIDFVIRRVV